MIIDTIIFDFYGVILKNIKENVLLGSRELIPYEETISFIRSIPIDYTLAIGSASNTLIIKEALEIFNLVDHFKIILGASDVANFKPHPEVYEKVLHKLNKTAEQAIVIEDSPAGIEAAHAAGLKCAVVLNSHTRKQLQTADIFLPNFETINFEGFLELIKKS
ncbi:HAD-IA family hydrolase [Candidatus Dojkabacteria bacterium]|nr:HAD-IA family hydrolase [Candidatus Dojkabacteria bacterium]